MGWTTEESGFDSRQEKEIFLFSITPRSTPTHLPIQWVAGAVSEGR
jgi:hypothetical protein